MFESSEALALWRTLQERTPSFFAIRALVIFGVGALTLWMRAFFPELANRSKQTNGRFTLGTRLVAGILNLLLLLLLCRWCFLSFPGRGGRAAALLGLTFAVFVQLLGFIPLFTQVGQKVLLATHTSADAKPSTLLATAVGTAVLALMSNVPLLGGPLTVFYIFLGFGVGLLTLFRTR